MSPWAKTLSPKKLAAFRSGRLAQLFIAYDVSHPDRALDVRNHVWKLLDFLQDAGVVDDGIYEFVIDSIHEMERKGHNETVIVVEVSAAKMQNALVADGLKEKFRAARKNPKQAAAIIFYPAGELINVLETPLD